MTQIIKYYHHQGHLDELITRYPMMAALKEGRLKNPSKFHWQQINTGEIRSHLMISFFGKSGYGKSSTVNRFFGENILETSDITACTSRCDTLDFAITEDYCISFADYPGIGESQYKDQEYLQMYRDFLTYSHVVVYVLRADMRDYSIDEQAYSTLFDCSEKQRRVIFAINCCDKIEPISRTFSKVPTQAQQANITEKIQQLEHIFQPSHPIIPYSAHTGWNLDLLAYGIVQVAKQAYKQAATSELFF